jgi:2-polyprenyl-6-methoxyphenol hydroxylase-like FAD-dependent oxidoreductase
MFQTLSEQESAKTSAPHGRIVTQAIVIGSSIAGLAAAKTLANYIDQVTIIERDEPAFMQDFRSGVPQARHAHTLMPQGQAVLEHLFPGLVAELIANGAVAVNIEKDVAFFHTGDWRTPQQMGRELSISCSRPMLENAIYQRVTALPNVTIMRGCRAVGLVADASGHDASGHDASGHDASGQQVTGVLLHSGRGDGAKELVKKANLVVDASGRGSQAPKWLASLNLIPPEEWCINAFVGYTTRIYQKPANFAAAWKRLYVRHTPPDGTRGVLYCLWKTAVGWLPSLVLLATIPPPMKPASWPLPAVCPRHSSTRPSKTPNLCPIRLAFGGPKIACAATISCLVIWKDFW